MKKNCLILLAFSILFFRGYSQQLSQVTFSHESNFLWFSLLTNQNILIRISNDGKILEFGTEEHALYNKTYYAQKLQPYLGRVDYYEQRADSAFRGKIKSIGTCFFTYYPSSDFPEKIGKIRSAGNLFFDYYIKFQDALIEGKIKSIGSNAITYYTSLDEEALRGKLQMVGNTSITYYSSFDNIVLKGKLKSIGASKYTWYTSYDRRELAGTLKSGAYRRLINGIMYILQQ